MEELKQEVFLFPESTEEKLKFEKMQIWVTTLVPFYKLFKFN